jgi:uncharacterized membrane protein YuzA (DUF378 family)
MKATALKSLDIVAYSLLLIGALNWGLVGFFGLDLVAAIFGNMTIFSRVIYALVGLAAIYDLTTMPSIMRRWDIHVRRHPVHA